MYLKSTETSNNYNNEIQVKQIPLLSGVGEHWHVTQNVVV